MARADPGTQSQLNFLPESHTDFIIAVLAEEFGLIGVLGTLGLYLLLIGRCMVIALNAQSMFGRIMAGTISLTFFVYIFVNMGMVSGILPVVGAPLIYQLWRYSNCDSVSRIWYSDGYQHRAETDLGIRH